MTHLNKLNAAVLAASVLLTACGGGGDDASSQGPGGALSANLPASKLPSCPAPAHALVDITAVQGPGHTSPLEGQLVSVRGIVTADFRGTGGLGGLFIRRH